MPDRELKDLGFTRSESESVLVGDSGERLRTHPKPTPLCRRLAFKSEPELQFPRQETTMTNQVMQSGSSVDQGKLNQFISRQARPA
jgi:hypothetical protein